MGSIITQSAGKRYFFHTLLQFLLMHYLKTFLFLAPVIALITHHDDLESVYIALDKIKQKNYETFGMLCENGLYLVVSTFTFYSVLHQELWSGNNP